MFTALSSWISFPLVQIGSNAPESIIVPMSGSSDMMSDFVNDRPPNRLFVAPECQFVRNVNPARSISQDCVSR